VHGTVGRTPGGVQEHLETGQSDRVVRTDDDGLCICYHGASPPGGSRPAATVENEVRSAGSFGEDVTVYDHPWGRRDHRHARRAGRPWRHVLDLWLRLMRSTPVPAAHPAEPGCSRRPGSTRRPFPDACRDTRCGGLP
jgi:hypothetical protein